MHILFLGFYWKKHVFFWPKSCFVSSSFIHQWTPIIPRAPPRGFWRWMQISLCSTAAVADVSLPPDAVWPTGLRKGSRLARARGGVLGAALLDRTIEPCRMGPPKYVSWFINQEITPMNTIVISTIKPLIRQLSYLGGPILWGDNVFFCGLKPAMACNKKTESLRMDWDSDWGDFLMGSSREILEVSTGMIWIPARLCPIDSEVGL